MELRQRKRINNQLPRFDIGDDAYMSNTRSSAPSLYSYGDIDTKGILSRWTLPTYTPPLGNPTTINQIPQIQAKVPDTDTTKAFKAEKLQKGFGNAMDIANTAVGMATNMMSSMNVKGTDQLQTESGSHNATLMGVNYDEQNNVDGTEDLKQQSAMGATNTLNSTISGAATGAKIGGPWGAAIGGVVGLGSGLFGWIGGHRKLKKRIEQAKLNAITKRVNQAASAMTKGLQNKYYLDNGDTSAGILYT